MSGISKFKRIYSEGVAAEHPDIAGQKEFASRADEILARRKRDRAQSGKNAKLDAIGRKLYNMNKIGEETELGEKIDVGADAGATISDFVHSKSKTFKGDSKKERIKRALGAYYAAKRAQKEEYELDESSVGDRARNTVADQRLDDAQKSTQKSVDKATNPKNLDVTRASAHIAAKKSERTARNMHPKPGTTGAYRIEDPKPNGSKPGAYRITETALEVAEEIENLEEKARGTKPKRTVHAYDVDETLFSHGKKGKPNVQVHVKDSSGKRVQSLSNQEFNTHKLQKGHSYDFSEFQSAKKFKETSSPNKKVIKHLQKQVKRGENVHLITARSKFDDPKEFHGHLKKHGIDVPVKNIHYTGGMKGGDIGDKKVKVANAIAKQSGTTKTHMYDDAAKVHKSFEAEKQNKPTSAKIKTHLVKPNKEGTPMSRSYQATKEELLIKFPGKENIQNENKELSPYEYWNTFIRENKVESQVIEEQVQEEVVIEEETDLGSYSYWKSVLQEEKK